jgi:SOS response regulatory protein OraA/RecX
MSFDETVKGEDTNAKKPDPRDVALKHLAHRDRTCQEMRKHLREREYTAEEIESAINYLLDMNYLNDVTYTEKYIEYGVSKGKGSLKIKGELLQKGIDKYLVEDILSCSEKLETQNERERALEQALKIVSNIKINVLYDCDDDFNTKAQKYKELQRIKTKVARRLENLGYSRDVIFATVDEVFNNKH